MDYKNIIKKGLTWNLYQKCSPKNDCRIADMKSMVFLPNLSESTPLMIPPVSTPTKKNISATFFKYSLSQTRLHSDVHVFPKLSFVANSHDWHFVEAFFDEIPSCITS